MTNIAERSRKKPSGSDLSRFQNWDAEALINKAADPRYRRADRLSNLLEADWFSFSAEYVRAQLVTQIPMTLQPEMGILGMNSSYQDGLDHQGQGFIEKLNRQGKKVSRAEIEQNNLLELNNWSLYAPTHSIFVWSSPPGAEEEGYGGRNSHSFTFVYQKTAPDQVVLHQFRSWMPLKDHRSLHSQLHSDSHPRTQSLRDHDLIADTIILNPSADLNEQQLEIWSNAQIQQVEGFVYKSSKSWSFDINEVPEVPEQQYQIYRDFLITLYIREVVPLLLEQVPEVDSEEWWRFSSSQEHARLIEQLDLAFAFLAYQPLLKFVELANENEAGNQGLIKGLLNGVLSNSGGERLMIEIPLPELESQLRFLYQTKLSEIHGGNIDPQLVEEFNNTGRSLLSSANSVFSQGQCGIGSLFSNSISKNNVLSSLANPSLSGQFLGGFGEGFSMQEKLGLIKELSEYKPLYIQNRDTGNVEVWYAKFLTNNTADIASYSSQCYILNGQIFGPCDVPLTPGNVPIDFVDEQIDMFSLMPADQYLQLLNSLTYSQSEEYFEEQLENQSLKEVLLSQATTRREKLEIEQLLSTAKALLAEKQVVSFTDLITGEIYHPLLNGVIMKLSSYAPPSFILSALTKEARR